MSKRLWQIDIVIIEKCQTFQFIILIQYLQNFYGKTSAPSIIILIVLNAQ